MSMKCIKFMKQMKHLFLLCISLLLSISVYGQKEVYEARLKEYKSKKEKITPNSQVVSDKYAKYYLAKYLYDDTLGEIFLNEISFKGVKSIKIRYDKQLVLQVDLDEEGRPTKITFPNEKGWLTLTYQKGLLQKVVKYDPSNPFEDTKETLLYYNDMEVYTNMTTTDHYEDSKNYEYRYARISEEGFLNTYFVSLNDTFYTIQEEKKERKGNKVIETREDFKEEYLLSNTKNHLPITCFLYGSEKPSIIKEENPTLWVYNIVRDKKIVQFHLNKDGRWEKIIGMDYKKQIRGTITYEYEMY